MPNLPMVQRLAAMETALRRIEVGEIKSGESHPHPLHPHLLTMGWGGWDDETWRWAGGEHNVKMPWVSRTERLRCCVRDAWSMLAYSSINFNTLPLAWCVFYLVFI